MLDAGELWTTYAPQIRRYLAARVGEDHADDVLSEVFLRVVRDAGRYEDRGWAPSAWIYGIARHRAIDLLRQLKRHPAISIEDYHATIDGPERALRHMFAREWARSCVERLLSGNQRAVIWLRFVEDLEIAEVAARLGLTEGAVKALQSRALCNLRSQIAPDDMPSMMVAFQEALESQAAEPPACSAPGCTERGGKRSGLCKRHYEQRYRANRAGREPFGERVSKTCAAPNCHVRAAHADGYCKMHHYRMQMHGQLELAPRQRDLTCQADGCKEPARTRGYCSMHYERVRHPERTLRAPQPKVCRAPDCERATHARGYCIMHYERWRRHGDSREQHV